MRHRLLALAALAVITLAIPCDAAFIPLTVEEKSIKADLVVVAQVVSITRLEVSKSSDVAKNGYMGPRALATVEISAVWKDSGRQTKFMWTDSAQAQLGRTIFVPCGYRGPESPSDLTVGQHYVMFLKALGVNMFHPLDPASTHVLNDGRVATFGMNELPKEFLAEHSVDLEEFKKQVMKAIATEKK